MLYETIHSHAQIQSLQARSDKHMRVNLVSLESVRMAFESYAILRPLLESRSSWVCSELELLSVVAGLALELHKLEDDLLPQLMVQEAKLERVFLLMQNSAIALSHLRKAFKDALGGLLDEDPLSAQVQELSVVLKDTAVHVLKCNCSIVWVREGRLPWLVRLVTALLATPVRFSDSE